MPSYTEKPSEDSALFEFIHGLLPMHPEPGALLQILRQVQARYRHIPGSAMQFLAQALRIPVSKVQAVTEFYSFLHTEPCGEYDFLISDSITDQMLGKIEVMDYLCAKLGIEAGRTRADGLVSVDNTSCTGLCDQGPAGLVNEFAITGLDRTRIDRIVDLVEQRVPLDQWPEEFFKVEDHVRRAGLLLGGELEPGRALNTCFERGLPETLEEIEKSDLRGRGGAGFRTHLKWKICHDAKGPRYVVCNADEGEPGTFKDRVLLSSYADQIIEGMSLCALITGARHGFIYLRAEYRYLLESLQETLRRLRKAGLLGENIQGRDFSFDIEIHLGAGAYICGEESALIESLEGKPGIPRIRPPYPVMHGYLKAPTVVDNPETFVAAAHIAVNGGAWFAAHGTKTSTGTKLLSISGDCKKPGVYEVPFGTSVREILTECGAKDVFGVQVGGPAGTFISDRELDRRISFEDLPTGGSFMIFDSRRKVLEITRNFLHFFAHESCGFCTPCRVGTTMLAEKIDLLCSAQKVDVDEMKNIGEMMKQASHCGLGQTAANPLLSTLERYPELYAQC